MDYQVNISRGVWVFMGYIVVLGRAITYHQILPFDSFSNCS